MIYVNVSISKFKLQQDGADSVDCIFFQLHVQSGALQKSANKTEKNQNFLVLRFGSQPV
jgi:hypothetical protein